MAYKKFRADNIFTGIEMLDNKFVLVTNENGYIEDIILEKDAGSDVQYFHGLLTPGFVNCHCHLELSHMKSLVPERTGLVDFVFKVVAERYFNDEEILEAIVKAEDEMIANGIVAVGDICNNTLTLSQKLKGRLAYYNFIEVSGWLPQIAEQRFNRGKLYYDAFVNIGSSIINENGAKIKEQTSLVPHAPYSVSEELWNLIQPFLKNKTISIHNQETSFEDELFIQNAGDVLRMYQLMKIDNSFFKPTGKSSLQSYFHRLRNAQNIILVHNTYTAPNDIEFANLQSSICDQQLFWCLCVNANLYIENKVPPVDMFAKNKCTIVLGTDSLASNHSLNLLDEMKSIQKYFPDVTTQQLLQWATANGARALQMDDMLGTFEKGKQPGVVLIDSLGNQNISESSTAKRLI